MDGWDHAGRACRESREMTRVRLLPSRSSQSSCVHVPVAYPQLDCKLLEGSHHFSTAVPRQPGGWGFWKPLGQEKVGLRNLRPYWGGKIGLGKWSHVWTYAIIIFSHWHKEKRQWQHIPNIKYQWHKWSMFSSMNSICFTTYFIYPPPLSKALPFTAITIYLYIHF